MLQPRQPVPLICDKPRGFRYNRRDIQFDEPFEAVSPSDADVLVKAKLARRPPSPDAAARARDDAAAGDNRSHLASHGEGITSPEVTLPDPASVASSDAPPELGGPAPKKKRVRTRKPKANTPPDQP